MASSTPEDGRRTVLLTRPLEDSRETAALLAEDAIPSEIWPLTAIRPVALSLSMPPTADGLVFTSAHGARAFAALCPRRDLPAFCVGARTAEAARRLGFAGAVAAGGDAARLAAFLPGTGLAHLFHPRGRDAAADLAALLAPSGMRVTEAVVYAAEETGAPPAPVADGLATGRIGIVTLWSRRNAAILAAHARAGRLALAPSIEAVAISAPAAEPLAGLGLAAVHVAEAPDRAGMLAAIRARA